MKFTANIREFFFLAILFLVMAILYGAIAYYSEAATPMYVMDILNGQAIFNADDGFRYLTAKHAWLYPDVYTWNYMLPVQVFLDGIIVTLAGEDVFIARATHIIPSFMVLLFSYKAGVVLGIERKWLAVSCIILVLMPLYAFVSLSFYGEVWLALFVAATLYFLAGERYWLAALFASLLPLVRVEGIFYWVMVASFFLYRKDYRIILLMVFPGVIHFFSLFFILDDLYAYFSWRVGYRNHLEPTFELHSPLYSFDFLWTVNALWVVPALISIFHPTLFKKIWPLVIGSLVWIVFLWASIHNRKAFYEARYLISLFPVLLVGWAFFIEKVGGLLYRWRGVAAATLLFFIVTENLLQMDPIRSAYTNGGRIPVGHSQILTNSFIYLHTDVKLWRREAVSAIYKFLRANADVDAVVVFEYEIYRYLNPYKMPRDVRVSWAPMSSDISLTYHDNKFYAMHPHGNQSSIYEFRTLDSYSGPVALYVGDIQGCNVCEPVYEAGPYKIYAFSYRLISSDF